MHCHNQIDLLSTQSPWPSLQTDTPQAFITQLAMLQRSQDTIQLFSPEFSGTAQ